MNQSGVDTRDIDTLQSVECSLLCFSVVDFVWVDSFQTASATDLTPEQATDRKNHGSGGTVPPEPCAFRWQWRSTAVRHALVLGGEAISSPRTRWTCRSTWSSPVFGFKLSHWRVQITPPRRPVVSSVKKSRHTSSCSMASRKVPSCSPFRICFGR